MMSTEDFLLKTMRTRRQWDTFNVLENKCQPRILYPANIHLQTKTFTDTNNEIIYHQHIHTTRSVKGKKQTNEQTKKQMKICIYTEK